MRSVYMLTVKAFANFDTPHNIRICAFNNKTKANYVKTLLNDFVAENEHLNNDYRFSKILENNNTRNNFISKISMCLNYRQSKELFEIFNRICKENLVYINSDIFNVKELKIVG